MITVQPIILCGGPGARLWPESTAALPKPFLDLLGGKSLFQRTVERMAAIDRATDPLIVTGAAYVDIVRGQLDAIGRSGFIMAEPIGRDSGPALLAAALWIARQDPARVAVAVASDHHIPDEAAFAQAVADALLAAQAGEIVTFGVMPTHPATGYGYIRPAEALGESSAVRRVGRFVEKPDAARAAVLLEEGCVWNSGNFMFQAGALLGEAAAHAPDLIAAVEAALDEAAAKDGLLVLGPTFRTAPKRSIDVAVMEKTFRAAVLPIAYAWSDVGSWDQVWAASLKDGAGNAVSGRAAILGARDCLIRAGAGSRVIALGLRDIAVVTRGGDVVVSDMSQGGDMKAALAALESLETADAPAPPKSLRAEALRLGSWLSASALPIWWCFGADHAHGGFHEALMPDLRPAAAPRRVRVQARQIQVYASAGLRGWSGPWRSAVAHGLDALFTHYRRSDGLYRSVVTSQGDPVDNRAFLYDQAFALLALATAAAAEPARREDLQDRAIDLLTSIRRAYAHDAGGFRAEEAAPVFLANPLMHLFEAAQACEAVFSDPVFAKLTCDLATLFLDHLYDPALSQIREVFDTVWRPAPGAEGRRLEPGHHFEWAWLIASWGDRHGDPAGLAAARRLFRSGARGVSADTGLVCDALNDDFSVRLSSSRLWPQTERLKSALILSRLDGESEVYAAAALSAAQAMGAYIDTVPAGLWRDEAATSGQPMINPAPASSLYHIAGAIAAFEAPVSTPAKG